MDPRLECRGIDAGLLPSIPITKTMYGLFRAYSKKSLPRQKIQIWFKFIPEVKKF
jgi:hypothetical protein